MEPRVPEKQDSTSSKNSTTSSNSTGTTSSNSIPSLSMSRSSSHSSRGHLNRPTAQIWNITVCPTTGGSYNFKISSEESVENFKRTVGRSLKLAKERINLLHKECVLKEGLLRDYGVVCGSRLTLLPNVESGLLSQKSDATVTQALESLSEHQVNEFLTGKSPLTLAMRLGDHMMFVQLQLSTSSSGSRRSHSSRSGRSSSSYGSSSRHSSHMSHTVVTPTMMPTPGSIPPTTGSSVKSAHPSTSSTSSSKSDTGNNTPRTPVQPKPVYPHSLPRHSSHKHTNSLPFPLAFTPSLPTHTTPNGPFSRMFPSISGPTPSTSGRSSSQIVDMATPSTSSGSSTTSRKRDRSPSLNSGLFPNKSKRTSLTDTPRSRSTELPREKDSIPPANKTKSHYKLKKSMSAESFIPSTHAAFTQVSKSSSSSKQKLRPHLLPSPSVSSVSSSESTPSSAVSSPESISSSSVSSPENTPPSSPESDGSTPISSAPAGVSPASAGVSPAPAGVSPATSAVLKNSSGAIIESMHHHGQGVYSGTFSGTLNPSLQERDGRPKKSVNTIMHILNDLLGASPQYKAHINGHLPEVVHAHTHAHTIGVHRPRSSHHHRNHKTIGERIKLSQENKATKGKMENLRQMLAERRQKRRQRRESRGASIKNITITATKNAENDPETGNGLSAEQTTAMDAMASEGAPYTEYKQETAVA